MIALNNIFANSTVMALKEVDGNSIAAYNLYWNNGIDESGSNVDTATSLYTDPMLFLNQHLSPGSPAIDAGTAYYEMPGGEVVLDLPNSDYFGTAPDLGALESDFLPGNQAPTVNAGSDDSITLPAGATLDGTVTDDGIPTPPSLTTVWSVTSGPDTVTFADAGAVDTIATFSTEGIYVLRLTADDGELTTFDELTLTINPAGSSPVLVSAGDIADCGVSTDEETALLLDNIPGTVVALGDIVYESATTQEFNDCYEPNWGRHKARTRPTPGNHDYATTDASGYFNYFGALAGAPNEGYYSYDLGDWHIIALNSGCTHVGGCETNSPQGQWLQADLAATTSECILAYAHYPRFSSGGQGSSLRMADFWQLLYDAGADVVLGAHNHNYERFARQDPSGQPDPRTVFVNLLWVLAERALALLGPPFQTVRRMAVILAS